VGDFIVIKNKQPLPADAVVLATSEDEDLGYIETSQIDGETNLKLRRALPLGIKHTPDKEETLSTLLKLRGEVECEGPNMRVNSFVGKFTPAGKEAMPIDIENVLLRGSVLRNTKWAIGVVVYTGDDTKLQVGGPSAFSVAAGN
jgi:magnesium-transporting ATPase (P-type)